MHKNIQNQRNMECVTITNNNSDPNGEEDQKLKDSDSAENFQHFICELFEKNGILNDLRAYLRGHIIDVLKSAQTGETPTCQKNFTQRLDVTNQALNMLVAEYLLRYDFSYSLSVFISEIPLANMVFGLAKTLMIQSDFGDYSKLRFSDSDIWSILKYLGIKCDSVHASNIVENYNNKESPLLLCMLKCLPFHCRQDNFHKQEDALESSLSEKSSGTEKHAKLPKGHYHEKCMHYAYCKACQGRFHSYKEKYAKKKKHVAKNVNIPPESTEKFERLVKNISYAEKAVIDEMFHQLKTVYEAEVDMVKQEEEKKYKQVLAKYALQLQKIQNEMEERFKERELELQSALQHKKRFLWGLAQALRGQHQHMAAAMARVRGRCDRLTDKEENLKTLLVEAENVIKTRGEDMRAQISSEILVLERHLESMRKERETIDKEKSELEKFKTLCESKIKLINDDSQIDSLRKEIADLKNIVERKKVCVTEKCVMTDLDGGRMNNQEVGMKSDSEERGSKAPNQVVNDLKKQKNVNFNQSQNDASYRESRRRSQSTDAFEERETRRDAIFTLREENDRLKHFARQQEHHIDELNIQAARLQAQVESLRRGRPRTAPFTRYDCTEPRLNTSISAEYNMFARGLGAGEESFFSTRNIPRHDAIRERQTDSRRYLIQQWRALRRTSPIDSSRDAMLHTRKHSIPPASALSQCLSVDTEPMRETAEEINYCANRADQDNLVLPPPEVTSQNSKARCKSPKSMLKEAKMRLRNNDNIPRKLSNTKREKSPNSVLREAKLRLRKLEIEAEAVEKSYLDFRKRQTMREETRCGYMHEVAEGLDANILNNESSNIRKCKIDLDKFLNKYDKKFSSPDSRFSNKSPNRARVIPDSYVELDKANVKIKDGSYLETPLTEFRKLYSQKSPTKLEKIKAKRTLEETRPNNNEATYTVQDTRPKNNEAKHTVEEIRPKNNDRQEMEEKIELKEKMESPDEVQQIQILEENMNKLYNLNEQAQAKQNEEVTNDDSMMNNGDKNLLRIEIESDVETNNLKFKESDAEDLLLVVKSTVEEANLSKSDFGEELTPHISVLVSPKAKNIESEVKSHNLTSNVLELPEKLNADVDTLFQTEKDIVKEPNNGSQDNIDSILSDQDKPDDYADDFSADVDNYNSRSEYDNSPVSHLKTSEDENFWDS